MAGILRAIRVRATAKTPWAPLWLRLAAPMLILVSCSPAQAPPGSGAPASSSSSPAPQPPAADVVPPGSAGEPYAKSRTYAVEGATTLQAWILCDGIDVGRLYVVGLPDANRQLSVGGADKAAPGAATSQSFTLGQPDPGAGQVYWPLTGPANSAPGDLHAFNPGALTSPADAFTPTFTSMKIGQTQASCRWVERTRLMGFSARRTFLITQADDRTLTYQTFDFKDAASAKPVNPDGAQRTTTPTLQVVGGRETAAGFSFDNNGYTYQIAASPAGATVTVLKAGQQVQQEPLTAWTLAPAP